MGVVEIVILAVVGAILLTILGIFIWRKVRGKKSDCGCGGGSSCANCSGCSAKAYEKKKKVKK